MNDLALPQRFSTFKSVQYGSVNLLQRRSTKAASRSIRRLRVPRAEATGQAVASAKRAVVILPGLGNSKGDYLKLASELEEKGLAVTIAEVSRVDWLRNAAGLRYGSYWRGTLQPRPTVDWYLNKVDAAVDTAKRQTDGAPLTLLAHSAGGWLSRVYLRDFGVTGIDRLVTLGSPHLPPPAGVVDQTRGILTFCYEACPGNYHPEVSYVTVAGKYVKGAPLRGEGTWQQRIVGVGYQQVCGEAEVWGDGVVPVPAAHLEGAVNLDLDGVYHSPIGSLDGAEDGSTTGRPWYGTRAVLEQWINHVVADQSELRAVEGEEAVKQVAQ